MRTAVGQAKRLLLLLAFAANGCLGAERRPELLSRPVTSRDGLVSVRIERYDCECGAKPGIHEEALVRARRADGPLEGTTLWVEVLNAREDDSRARIDGTEPIELILDEESVHGEIVIVRARSCEHRYLLRSGERVD